MLDENTKELIKNKYGEVADFEIWCQENYPDMGKFWRPAWIKRMQFIRDILLNEFTGLGHSYEIVDTLYSKSILCPVMKIKYKSAEIVFNYNFYYWEIMVKAEEDIDLSSVLDYIKVDGKDIFYNRIPNDYRFDHYSTYNRRHFAFTVRDVSEFSDLALFKIAIVFFVLKEEIDKVVDF